ncbi:phospholipid-transporting ATPase 1-like [Telopea speciosissima]|uniref:phospholipid-transporting ATPase 1-like n=1 Tax=Telopea speciosissima TaxID=54955 RepID=UPI001CC653E3|nr:phospholipid-transporting ATPase 1-like [Telopea speciosissima]
MTSERSLLKLSPQTPTALERILSISSFSDLSKPARYSPVAVSAMDQPYPADDSHYSGTTPRKSSSLRSVSIQSKDFGRTSVGEGNSSSMDDYGRSGSKPVRHGSKSAESEGYSLSQKEINDDEARFIYINDPEKTNEKCEFTGNLIRTSKYSFLTFLPKNLFQQFHRVAYIYFLAIAILNQLPQLAVFGRGASIMPLAFVLLVTAIKDAYEDWRRHRSDRIENNRLASVMVNGKFQQKKWKDIQVGEILKIFSNETLPCDMVLLSTSDPTGVAYIQTLNLDGESNLKTRYAKQETQWKMLEKDAIHGLIKCERPNRNIYGFQANMEIDGKQLSLGPSNIVLRGCDIKNTAWVTGVAVYAGRETKAMLNSSGSPSKRSRLETRMNQEILYLSAFLVTLCAIVSVCAGVWLFQNQDQLDYIPFFIALDFNTGKNNNYSGVGLQIFFTFLMSVIVFQIMIPISLYISMELVRLGQAYFMIRDARMYDETTNSRFQCRALNINEDLGQIKYIFSDKTGTLTQNKMEFQCASIGGVDYSGGRAALPDEKGYAVQVDGQVLRPKMTVKADPELQWLLKDGNTTEEGKWAHDFFLALAACNTIVPLVVDTSDPSLKLVDYQGESPDEQALVYAAATYGFMLIERTSGYIVIDVQGERQRFDILGMHEFDSDRKRMSVIVGCPDKTMKIFVKGADNSMFSVIDRSLNLDVIDATEKHLRAYSSFGLRTLVVAMRELSGPEFEQWQSAYERASTALIGRASLLRTVACDVEKNLHILGASAIEDKLQEGVPEAIESLRQAGIKVWVLTGDKQETAISIGYSCKLLTSDMTQIIINSNSMQSCRKSFEEGMAMSKKLMTVPADTHTGGGVGPDRAALALIIDGTSLVHILDTDLEQELFELATVCSVVLCCRVAPMQKAGIVALIKKRTEDMTLAIGDGANDVAMIQMADVGIGISGQEGRQAVMASDFAMGQFRFLLPLLLVHGHWNYQRMGYMILYNFYRNAVFVLVMFWYVLYTAFTLTTAINEWSSMLYTILYTSMPTIVVGILDKDLGRGTLMKYPQLYGPGQREECYNKRLFWLTMVDTVWQSVAMFYVPFFAYSHSTIDGSSIGDLWTILVVIVVNIHLAMDIIRWSWITHAAIWGTILATCICIMVLDSIPVLPGYWAIFHLATTEVFWFCLLASTVVALVPRFVVKILSQFLSPTDTQIAREAEKFGNQMELLGAAELEMNRIRNPPQEMPR